MCVIFLFVMSLLVQVGSSWLRCNAAENPCRLWLGRSCERIAMFERRREMERERKKKRKQREMEGKKGK